MTAPDGTAVTLFDHADGGGNNLCRATFDDSAAAPFAAVTSTQAPFTGTWRPDERLADFLASPVDGDWRFTVADLAPIDTGSIRAVSLHITGFVRDTE